MMNVIFLDFDGVLSTIHKRSNKDIEKKVIILSEICKEFNCKVVIEASAKDGIDEYTLEPNGEYLNFLFDLFKKYNIEVIGRTPNVSKFLNKYSYTSIWKEDEIRLYLLKHPEIEHYCIIDDDDLSPKNSDLNKVRDHLVTTIYYSKDENEEGLLLKHKDEIEKILKKDNRIRKYLLKRKKF